jgi:hypothetical protein
MHLMQLILDSAPPTIDQFTSLGMAGVMGAMWLWERRMSRVREEQIDESHARIMSDRVLLDELMLVIKQNTEAITRLADLSAVTMTLNKKEN